jgi:3-dehydroquinate dehydratase/shikimate dehydrogenase
VVEYLTSLTRDPEIDLREALLSPPAGATMVELRIDLYPDVDLRSLISASPLPTLVTLRSAAEGGHGTIDPNHRKSTLLAAREAGATLLDLEFARDLHLFAELGLAPEHVVLSWHDASATPADLADTTTAMLDATPGLVKVVPTARRLEDVERVLRLYEAPPSDRRRLLAWAMGPVGVASRYLAPLLGAPLAFTSWDESSPAAPGQLTIDRLTAVTGHLDGPPKRLYGVVGSDVSDSLSPRLHSTGYRAHRLPYLFVPVSVAAESELDGLFTVEGSTIFDRVGIAVAGWAVTTPFKRRAASAATHSAPRVRRAEAANTLILRRRQIVAENTDADGIVGSLTSRGIDPRGVVAVVQGTGGAARGAAVGLDLAGATVVLRGRDAQHTAATAHDLGVGSCRLGDLPPDAALLVNATPLGSSTRDPSPFSRDEVARACAVLDMVYADHPTALELAAGDCEVPLIDGREILLHQGIAQFAAFTGLIPPKEEMRTAIRRAEGSV